jgi:hypothetical protein
MKVVAMRHTLGVSHSYCEAMIVYDPLVQHMALLIHSWDDGIYLHLS